MEPYVDTSGVLRRAVAYGDDSNSLLIWYDVEEMQAAMQWVIPETSPWANTKKWRSKLRASPQPKEKQAATGSAPRATGNVPRATHRGTVPRGSAQRGRVYPQRGRGRGQSYPEDGWEENSGQSRGRYNHPEPDWQYEPPVHYNSGPGRSTGPASNPKRNNLPKPWYRDSRNRREDSRDRRDRRDRDRYNYRNEEQYSDESSDRDTRRGNGRRNYGEERAKSYGYRRAT